MRVLILSFLICFTLSSFAQQDSIKYWIKLSDKNHNTFSVQNPQVFLSQEAIQRRLVQNIPIVENDLPVTQRYIDSILATGAKIHTRSKWLNAVTITTNDTAILKKVLNLPFVVNSQKVAKAKSDKKYSNNILLSDFQYSASKYAFNYGPSYNQIQMLNGDVLHDLGYTGKGMIIAVIDAGFYRVDQLLAFIKLRDENRILSTWDFVDNEQNVYDDDTHGTSVLSTMAAFIPGLLIGTAPDASYILLRSEQAASELIIEEDNWIAAAEYADSAGADIINTSLGYSTFDDPSMDHTYADMDGNTTRITIAADIAASKGILVVNSAGNEGNSSWKYITAPADGDSVLAVGAVDSNGIYVTFSSIGPSFDGRVKPNVAAQGRHVVVTTVGGDFPIQYVSGTSFASPILAGMAATLWSAHPEKKNMEIFNAIERSGNLYPDYNYFVGYGIPDFVYAHYILGGDKFTNIEDSEYPYIFPNPFSEQFNLTFFNNASIEIYDVLGRLIFTQTYNYPAGRNYTVRVPEVQTLQSGVYFMRIESSGKTYVRKIVKN